MRKKNLKLISRWISYEEADTLADNFGRGLRVLGQQHGESVCMFADTRHVVVDIGLCKRLRDFYVLPIRFSVSNIRIMPNKFYTTI